MAPPAKKKKKHSSANPRLISTVGRNQQQPMGSSLTPFVEPQSVRLDHKMNKPLKQICICNDVWWNVLPFLGRSELGLKLALLSFRFDWLVDKHFGGGKTELTIRRKIAIAKDRQTKEAKLFVRKQRTFVQLPKSPLPVKIRFSNLRIKYIDHSVITFLRTNKQIFDKGTKLELEISDERKISNVIKREIWPIFAGNIRHLVLRAPSNKRCLISSTVLTDFKRLNTIDLYEYEFPNAIAQDGSISALQEVAKWLHTPTIGGQTKRLNCELCWSKAKRWINNFKEEFLNATASVHCAIKIDFYFDKDTTPIEPFELVNERTGEKLTLTKEESDEDEEGSVYEYEEGDECGHWLLMRCPIGKTIQREDESLENLSCVHFWLYARRHIGPLSSPTTAGPSKEKVV